MNKAPALRVIVDLDCDTLRIPRNGKHCDYLFVGEESEIAWVAPIELKGGNLGAQDALDQLQGGVRAADTWLPQRSSFQFVPVLAHGKRIHKQDLRTLNSRKLTLRGQKRQTVLIRCGDPLKVALSG